MRDQNEQLIAALLGAKPEPLTGDFKRRALAIARTNLRPAGKKSWSLAFADYMPPAALVPSLLISAATVFAIDSLAKIARFFGAS